MAAPRRRAIDVFARGAKFPADTLVIPSAFRFSVIYTMPPAAA